MHESDVNDPITYLLEEIPYLITSEDSHKVAGAAVTARYLADNAPNAAGVHNLVASTDKLEALVGSKHIPLGRFPRFLAEAIQPPLERIYRGIAFVSLTQFKSSALEAFDESDIGNLLEKGRNEMGIFSRFMTTHGMIRPFYENILNKEVPTEPELIAARAARLYTKKHTLSPLFFIHNVLDARKEKKQFTKKGLNH